jgi:hypothetical protein
VPIDLTTGDILNTDLFVVTNDYYDHVCDTVNIYGAYVYVICTYFEVLRIGGKTPNIQIWNKADFTWHGGVELNFGITNTWGRFNWGGIDSRAVISNSAVFGDKLFFMGITKGMFGTSYSRMSFISMFDMTLNKHGCDYAQTRQKSDYDLSSYLEFHNNLGISLEREITDLVVTDRSAKTFTDLDVSTTVFTYDMVASYIEN